MGLARIAKVAALLLLVGATWLPAQSPVVDWQAIARKLVERMQLVRGERVLLVGRPGEADALVPALRAAVRDAGGVDLGALAGSGETPAGWATDFARGARGLSGDSLDAYLATVDLAVMLPGAEVDDPPYGAMQRIVRSGRSRTIHFHWSGAYSIDGAPIPITDDVSRVYQRALLETDYAALGRTQLALDRAMRRGRTRVTTPAGTDISFEIGDRSVTRQDGDASAARARQGRTLIDREVELPAGAIRVAPIEESVRGRIAFPAGIWGGERVEGLVMSFDRGRLTTFEARTGRAGVERALAEGGDAARSFRELAVGLNPLLAIPASGARWIPYYGYGAGVVRLSLGDNTELGGRVTGGWVRWNFFTDATVTVGDELWLRDGRLVR
jgi:hypothetical protein